MLAITPGVCFLKFPLTFILGPRKLFRVCCVCIQDQSFNNFELINSSNWQWFRIKVLWQVPHRKHTKSNGQNSGGREVLKSRGKGTERRPSWRRQDQVVLGVATLDRGPDQSLGVRPICPSH